MSALAAAARARDAGRTRARAAGTAAGAVAVLASGILAGAVVAVCLVLAPLDTAALYLGVRQAADPGLTAVLPPLGALAVLATGAGLVAAWRSARGRLLHLAALACLVAGMAVTVLVHIPMNVELATWAADSPPAGWTELRDRWFAAHLVRTALSVAAFALLVAALARPIVRAGQRP